MTTEKDSAEISGFGMKAKVSTDAIKRWEARELFLPILIIACTIWLMVERRDDRSELKSMHAITQAQVKANGDTQIKALYQSTDELRALKLEIKNAALVQAYVISLPQDKRERLNLTMPDDLRQRIRSGTQ